MEEVILREGLYEQIINKEIQQQLNNLEQEKFIIDKDKIDKEEAKAILSQYISQIIRKSLNYIRDKEKEDSEKLIKQIETINADAHHLLRKEVKAFKDLYSIISSLLSESHKSKTENISNIKLLFLSTRNRDAVEILEKEFNLWNFYLEKMKNYVIINSTDKHE